MKFAALSYWFFFFFFLISAGRGSSNDSDITECTAPLVTLIMSEWRQILQKNGIDVWHSCRDWHWPICWKLIRSWKFQSTMVPSHFVSAWIAFLIQWSGSRPWRRWGLLMMHKTSQSGRKSNISLDIDGSLSFYVSFVKWHQPHHSWVVSCSLFPLLIRRRWGPRSYSPNLQQFICSS